MTSIQDQSTPETPIEQTTAPRVGLFPNVRWWIIAPLLLGATTLMHLDRNVLANAAPALRSALGIDEIRLTNIVICFQLAYMIMQLGSGRIIDWLGTRRGFTLSVCFWSLANMAHGLATGWRSMAFFRFMLGVGEAGNFPAGFKAIAEWYPPKERSVAAGVLQLGAGFGGLVAPILTVWLILKYSWHVPFVVTGAIGFIWVIFWLTLYRSPDEHPWVTKAELAHIHSGKEDISVDESQVDKAGVWNQVVRSRNVWAVAIARFFTEQPWSFFVVWIPTYLNTQRGMDLKQIGMYVWIPFVAADLGSLFGGFLSPFFRRLGCSFMIARKLALTVPCLTMIGVMFVFAAPSVGWALFFFCIGTFSHMALCATLMALPADTMPKRTVATSMGLTGMMGSLGAMISTYAIGHLAKLGYYKPIFFTLAFVDVIACGVVWLMVHKPKAESETG